jgi:hypothetical protein
MFIIMLRERFLKDLKLEDIWIYRVIQKGSNILYFSKHSYDLKKWHDVPLFTLRPTCTADEYSKD